MIDLIALPYRGFRWARKQSHLGFKWLRNLIWPIGLQFWQLVRAATQASGITITVLAAAYSIAIPYLLSAIDKDLILTPGLAVSLALLAIVLSVPLVLVSGWLALRTADPETYARILLGGRPAKEVLFTISRRIDRTCSRALQLSTWAEKLLVELEREFHPDDRGYKPNPLPSGRWRQGIDGFIAWISLRFVRVRRLFQRSRGPERDGQEDLLDARLREEIEVLVWWLRRFPHQLHTRLLRIETMKVRASAELDIPARRICDHVFQYSPAMHRDRLQKYVQNWGQILDSRPATPDDKRLLWDVVVQNLSFLNNTRRRRRYQREILENRDLHPYIVQFASKHSTSGSLQTYAEALRYVAMLGERRLAGSRGDTEQEVQAIWTRLAFLHRKQRAHPGFDLHALLLSALACMEKEQQGGLPAVRRILQELKDTRKLESGGPHPALSVADLRPFRHLSFRLANLIGAGRSKISRKFHREYADWFSRRSEVRYIVSHGYSRTVLSVLKSCLLVQGNAPAQELPRLFFLLPEVQESFDTRVMEYELKEYRDLRGFRSFAAGNESHLLGLLQKGDRVLVLLGAECFDRQRRMVHPLGIGPGLKALVKKLRRKNLGEVVVVAESYKCYRGSLTTDTNFYGQHFDRIDLYPPSLIDRIITDDKILVRPKIQRS